MHKKMQKKLNSLQPWILANNPGLNNSCECFKFKMPSDKWIAVARFETKSMCESALTHCEDLFRESPLHHLRHKAKMGMGMGMMR
jgi:hypothetical protein